MWMLLSIGICNKFQSFYRDILWQKTNNILVLSLEGMREQDFYTLNQSLFLNFSIIFWRFEGLNRIVWHDVYSIFEYMTSAQPHNYRRYSCVWGQGVVEIINFRFNNVFSICLGTYLKCACMPLLFCIEMMETGLNGHCILQGNLCWTDETKCLIKTENFLLFVL